MNHGDGNCAIGDCTIWVSGAESHSAFADNWRVVGVRSDELSGGISSQAATTDSHARGRGPGKKPEPLSDVG